MECPYLFDVLQRFDIKLKFLSCILLLCSNPQVEIVTNGLLSNMFKLDRGMRQGYPLSPLLFTLATESLAMAILNHNKITGITIGDSEHRIALFADNIRLFCSSLQQTLPALLDLIGSVCVCSGYKINNNSKSTIMFLAKNKRRNLSVSTPFAVSREGFIL